MTYENLRSTSFALAVLSGFIGLEGIFNVLPEDEILSAYINVDGNVIRAYEIFLGASGVAVFTCAGFMFSFVSMLSRGKSA